MMFDLDPSLLRTFVAVVETGRLTSAGRRVGRSQPAITHQIKRLELVVGRPLFGPDKRNLTLTADGEVLLRYARAVLQLNEEARQHFSGPSFTGHVVLGTPDLYAAHLLPEILASFSKAYPGVGVELHCRRSQYLQVSLRANELDLALVTRQYDSPDGALVRREPLVWATGGLKRPEAEKILPLALLPEGSVYREHALAALAQADRPWRIVSISDSIAGLQATLFAGLAVAVYPRCALLPGLRVLGARDGFPPLPWVDLVLLQRSEISAAARQLADHVARQLAEVAKFVPPETQVWQPLRQPRSRRNRISPGYK